jgi:hypothetical protein
LDLQAGIDLIIVQEEIEPVRAIFAIIRSLEREFWKGIEEEQFD